MKLIYATHNPAKINFMKEVLIKTNIDIKCLSSFENLVEPEEIGNSPKANAIIKAKEYFSQINEPLFSCDSALYFENVEDIDQPGSFIKRINKQNLTNKEIVLYYSNLATKYGGKITAYYQNAICLIINNKTIISYDRDDIKSEKFYIVNKPHEKYVDGFPLDSLSVEIKSGNYYYDLDNKSIKDTILIDGFKNFFLKHIKDL